MQLQQSARYIGTPGDATSVHPGGRGRRECKEGGGGGGNNRDHLSGGSGKDGEVPLIQASLAGILPHHAVDGQISIHKRVVEPPIQATSRSDQIILTSHFLLCLVQHP